MRSGTSVPQTETWSAPQVGAGYAVLAYGAWGLLPIYWKLFPNIPAIEVVAHRMLWSLFFVVGLIAFQRRLPELKAYLVQVKQLGVLLLTAFLLSANWGVYVYGVNSGNVVQTSLGYFINPLINVLFGFLFLRERFNRWQSLAVGLAAIGVANFVWSVGEWPWIALSLGVTFALYGLLRKLAPAPPLIGLAIETLLLAPVAAALIVWWDFAGVGAFGTEGTQDLLLLSAGVMTSLPLLWFANAGKRLRLSTLGLFQYIAPTLQFSLGVFLYGEPFTPAHAVTFAFIWIALVIYTSNTLWSNRKARQLAQLG